MGDGSIAISIESRRDGRYRAAQGLVWASRRRSMEKVRCLSIQQRIQEKRPFLKQKYRKQILPLVEHVLHLRLGARVNEQRNGHSGDAADSAH